jgi:glycine/D-amino acid oxidase-like deaminating enzyme
MGGLAAASIPRISITQQSRLSVGVVGGGIVGASIALHLAQAGVAVTVFEKTKPASGATSKSFAWINAFSDQPHYRALRLQSLLAFQQLDKELQLDVTWGGSLTWESEPDAAAQLIATALEFDRAGYPTKVLNAEEFSELAPNLGPGPFEAAIYAGLDGHLDPVRVTEKLLEQAGKLGARIIYPCEVNGLDFSGNRLIAVSTTTGKYQLDRIVIAGGVDTPAVTKLVDYVPPMRHAPGILAHSTPVQELTRTVNEDPTVHFKQMSNGRIVGADTTYAPDIPAHHDILREPLDFPNDAMRIMHGNRILEKITTICPGARSANLERLTLGYRPMPEDGFPIVGFVPGSSDVYIAVMHSGVTLAPIMGQYISREILDDISIDSLAPYRPARFAGLAGRKNFTAIRV